MNKSIFLPHFVVQRSTPDTEAEEFSLLCPRRKKDIIFFHCCLRHLPTPWSFSFINIKGGTLCSPDATQPSAQHLHEMSCSPGEFPQHLMLFCNTQKWVKKRGFGGSWCGSHKFMVGQSPFSHARRNAVGLTTLLPGSPSPAQVSYFGGFHFIFAGKGSTFFLHEVHTPCFA